MINRNLLDDAYELGTKYAQTEHEFKEHIKSHGSKFAKEFGTIISDYQSTAIGEFNDKHNLEYTYILCKSHSVCVICSGNGEKIEYTFNI